MRSGNSWLNSLHECSFRVGFARMKSALLDSWGTPSDGDSLPPRAGPNLHASVRALVLTPLLLLSGCVYWSQHTPAGACRAALDSPVRNFCVVDSGVLWRGESPTVRDAEWLVDHGVQSVFSIQLDARRSFEQAAVRPELVRTVTYFHVEG